MDMSSFVSEEVLDADISPPTTWNAFKEPKLRKFAQHDQAIK